VERRLGALVSLLALTLVAFWGVWTFEFLTYDDNVYVVGNEHVETGLRPANLVWALTTGHAANWHPVTWWSHQLDAQIHGDDSGGDLAGDPHACEALARSAQRRVYDEFLLFRQVARYLRLLGGPFAEERRQTARLRRRRR